jgi:hypothetical protein
MPEQRRESESFDVEVRQRQKSGASGAQRRLKRVAAVLVGIEC